MSDRDSVVLDHSQTLIKTSFVSIARMFWQSANGTTLSLYFTKDSVANPCVLGVSAVCLSVRLLGLRFLIYAVLKAVTLPRLPGIAVHLLSFTTVEVFDLLLSK